MTLLAWLCAVALAEPVRHAVVLGANEGGGILAPLLYAERDAEKMADILVELGGFDDQMVTVLYEPTPDAIQLALARHAAISAEYPDDLFLFYYSGHADASGLRIGDERYYFESLKADLRAIDAQVRLGILDACRSGAITRLKGASVGASILDTVGTVEGEAWLTAASAEEEAQESDELRGGFFTHYLLSGMRGAADTNDGVVDLQELYAYTRDQVVVFTGSTEAGPQHPSFDFRLAGAGAIAMSDIRRASATLTLASSVDGRISVLRLPDYTQMIELRKTPDRVMNLALPPGRYLVRRWSEGDLFEATLGVNDGAVIAVENWGTPRIPTDTISRGGSGALEAVEDRLQMYIERSRALEIDLNLESSPLLAGGASLLLPGAGQVYNRELWKGGLYLGATAGLMSGFVLDPAKRWHLDATAYPLLPTLGLAMWGASIGDAIYNVHRREEARPRNGVLLGFGLLTGGPDEWPWRLGGSVDLMMGHGVSIGLDHAGYTTFGPDQWDASLGSRFMVGYEGWDRWRPGVFGAFALRMGRDRQATLTRISAGPGVDLRYYVVPRYFLEVDGRYEVGAVWNGPVLGVGFGTHIGR